MIATWDIWYIDEGFLVWIIPLTYLSRESIIWACTTSFVHTCIYCMFNLFTACTFTLRTAFYACFQFQIHRYIWFTVVPLISLTLFVITCTCILRPHHLITYTCICHARHLILLYVLVGLRLTTLNSHVQILETRPWWPCCNWSSAQRILPWRSERSKSVDHRRSSSSQFLSCLVLEIPLVAREHLSAFVYLFPLCTLVFSSDVIFL